MYEIKAEKNNINKEATQKKPAGMLIAGVIYMVSIGVLYAWTVIRRVIEAEWDWTSTQSGLPFTLVLICFATGSLIGGRLQVKIPARLVGTIGGAMVGTGLVLSGLAGDSRMMVALCFGVVTGLGIGLGYSSFLPTLLKWYHPSRKGFVSGWIIGGFGLTALYLAPLASVLIENFGVQAAFIVLGIFTMAVSIPLAQCIKDPPEGYIPAEPANKAKTKSALPPHVDKTWKEMLATGKFYMLFIMFLCSLSIGQMVVGNIAGIVSLQAGVSDAALLAGLVSFMAISNTGGRIIGGIISDKIGWANTLIIVFVLHLINMSGFGFYNNLPTLIVGITLAGFCFGTTLSVFPVITVDQFGLRNYSSNYGIMYMAFGFAGIAAPVIASYFLDLSGNYNTVYIICAVGMGAMILTNLLVRRIIAKENHISITE